MVPSIRHVSPNPNPNPNPKHNLLTLATSQLVTRSSRHTVMSSLGQLVTGHTKL